MGLRSRHRRLAGVAHETSYDPEINRHRSSSLEDHLRASIDDVQAFNFMWKKAVAFGGFVVALHEAMLLYQILTTDTHAPSGYFLICLLLKLIAFTSIFSTRQYVQSGAHSAFGTSVVASVGYVLLWLACVLLLNQTFSMVQVSPLSVIYCGVTYGVLYLIGDNTKAEVARAQQLEKLEQLFNDVKEF